VAKEKKKRKLNLRTIWSHVMLNHQQRNVTLRETKLRYLETSKIN